MNKNDTTVYVVAWMVMMITAMLIGFIIGRLIPRFIEEPTDSVETTFEVTTEELTTEEENESEMPLVETTEETTVTVETTTTTVPETTTTPETTQETTSYYANTSVYDWLVRCVSAEEGGSYLRSWYAASCILNRCDATGMDIVGVISDPGQFAVYTSGVMWEKEPTQNAINACNAVLSGDRHPTVYYFASYDAHSGYARLIDIVDGEYFYERY